MKDNEYVLNVACNGGKELGEQVLERFKAMGLTPFSSCSVCVPDQCVINSSDKLGVLNDALNTAWNKPAISKFSTVGKQLYLEGTALCDIYDIDSIFLNDKMLLTVNESVITIEFANVNTGAIVERITVDGAVIYNRLHS